MAIRMVEYHGYDPEDASDEAQNIRENERCPFVPGECTKTLRDGTVAGACTLRQKLDDTPIICCPKRLYGEEYKPLRDVAEQVFGDDLPFVAPEDYRPADHRGERIVLPFGKGAGKELRIPAVGGSTGHYVDWILALIGPDGDLQEFVAAEVQSIDTTGNYRDELEAYLRGEAWDGWNKGGINWENVNKRILPQLIRKGHVLRREPLCRGGLFFICPTPVYERVVERVGSELAEYEPQPGSITFAWYNLGDPVPPGSQRQLVQEGTYTTTVDQVAYGFLAPDNLPDPGVYEGAIRHELP